MQSLLTSSNDMATGASSHTLDLSSTVEVPILDRSAKDSSIDELRNYLQRTSHLYHNSVSRDGKLEDTVDSGTPLMEIVNNERQDAQIYQDIPMNVQLHFLKGQMEVAQRELTECSMNISKLQLQMNLQIAQGVTYNEKAENGLKALNKDVEDLRGLYKSEMTAREVEFIALKAKLIEMEQQMHNEKKERESWEERYKENMLEVRDAVFSAFRQCLPAISRNLKDLKDAQQDSDFTGRRSRESLNSRLLDVERRCSSVEKRLLETLSIQTHQLETFKVEHKQADQKQMQEVDDKLDRSDSEEMSAPDELQESSPKKPCHDPPVQVQVQEQTQASFLSKDFSEESARRLQEIENQIAEFRKQDLAISKIIGQVGGNPETTGSTSSKSSDQSLEQKSTGANTLSETSMGTGSAISSNMFLLDSESQVPLATPMPVTTPVPVIASSINLSGKGPKIFSGSLCLPNSGDATSILPEPPVHRLPYATSIPAGRSTLQQTDQMICHQPLSSSVKSVTTEPLSSSVRSVATPRLAAELGPRPAFSTPSPRKNPVCSTSGEYPSPAVIPAQQSSSSSPLSMLSSKYLPSIPQMIWPLRTVEPVPQRFVAPEEQRMDRSRSQRRTFANYDMTQTSRQVTMATPIQRPTDSGVEFQSRPEQRTEFNGNARPVSRYAVV